MFWSGNYIAVRELNFLLKEENVSLSQVLEADDILQECKADNKALVQFLTRPEILAELITLITEEPPKNVELANQYRHANIACEVLTSHLSMLNDRLSLDATQMNRLCDFINKDPPLNPLLASYFSKTVEMLLERSPKQDWYLYHIVCLRVLDFFKSRRDFLPNLLRHMSTSAIADTFKYFIRLDELFKKTVMEWLEEHQFLECLIQIICGTYVPLELPTEAPAEPAPPAPPAERTERTEQTDTTTEANHTEEQKEGGEQGDTGKSGGDSTQPPGTAPERGSRSAERIAAVGSANAAALLCELVANGCAGDGCSARPHTSWELVSRLQAEAGVRALLQAMFTSPPSMRRHALVHGCQLLLALLAHEPVLRSKKEKEEEGGAECSSVELAVAPHLPLLHHALLQAPAGGGVGAARVATAALLAQLARSELHDVPTTLLTLGTPGVLIDMFFEHENNNFLHAQVHALVKHALSNRVYGHEYAKHLFIECDLLTRLMNVFEQNQNNKSGVARAAHMGHVLQCLAACARALHAPGALVLPPELAAAVDCFLDEQLRPLLQQHDTPLGGYYPSENIYDVEIMADTMAVLDYNEGATLEEMADAAGALDEPQMCGSEGPSVESEDFILDGLGLDDAQKKAAFLELSSQRFDDDMWDDPVDSVEDSPDVRQVLQQSSPWEGGAGGAAEGAGVGEGEGEGWAHFGESAEPFPGDHAFWPALSERDDANTSDLEESMRTLRLEESTAASTVELANNLLTAMSAMSPDALANLVNANLTASDDAPEQSHEQTQGQSTEPDRSTERLADRSTERLADRSADQSTEPEQR